jgi:5-methyltetrahydropteroyltriglutamate--homocysteine methyltransferase
MIDPSHVHIPDVSFDGGDLDCGNGLLLLIRKHIDPLQRGQLLEIRSTEISVDEDLPAWCRMTSNELVSAIRVGDQRSFLVAKGSLSERRETQKNLPTTKVFVPSQSLVPVVRLLQFPLPIPAPAIRPLSVMGIGSWPRPRWMLQAIHERLEGRLSELEFSATGDDAVRLAVSAQLSAGVDVVTDGEQRRDSYASFVAARLDNCQLIPLTDLLPLVEDPEAFSKELQSLDVPAHEVRHPAVFGLLGRSQSLTVHEAAFAKQLTDKPLKIALPGPYLLTRSMWMECISDRAYAHREALSVDVVRVLREEIACLLAAGVALVQLDEPILTEVVFGAPSGQRSFMCGALSAKGDSALELEFAKQLLNAVAFGFPKERLALHVCRGNWTPDESKALAGDYAPLVETLAQIQVGTFFLELCTPRAGEMHCLKALPAGSRIGVGSCNQKTEAIETVESVVLHLEKAVALFGPERVLISPDCGFATFADNPVSSASTAVAKLSTLTKAAAILRERYQLK